MYHAVTKQDVRTAYQAADFEGDTLAVNLLFGLNDKDFTHRVPA